MYRQVTIWSCLFVLMSLPTSTGRAQIVDTFRKSLALPGSKSSDSATPKSNTGQPPKEKQHDGPTQLTLQLVDVFGQSMVLDFDVFDPEGNQVKIARTATPAVLVPPGNYFIRPVDYPDFGQLATVTGAKQTMNIQPDRLLVLRVDGESVPLIMKPEAARKAALQGLWRRDRMPVLNALATPQEIDGALRLARKSLQGFRSPDDETINDYSQRQACLDILAVAGARGDADDLIRVAEQVQETYTQGAIVATATYIDARTGPIESGAVATALESSNKVVRSLALAKLMSYGMRRFPKSKTKANPSTEEQRDYAYAALAESILPIEKSYVKDTMRMLTRRGRRDENEQRNSAAASAAAIYLLAFQDDNDSAHADWKLASKVEIHYGDIRELAFVVEDPRPLARLFHGQDHSKDSSFTRLSYCRNHVSDIAELLPALRLLPSDRASAIESDVQFGIREMTSRNKTQPNQRTAVLWSEMSYSSARSYCLPSVSAAKWTVEVNAQQLSSGWTHAPDGDSTWQPDDELRRAAMVVTRPTHLELDILPQGIERQPILLKHPTGGGAVSAMVEVRPEMANGKLRLHVRLTTGTHARRTLAVEISGEYKKFQGLDKLPTRDWFGEVFIQRDKERIPVQYVGEGENGFVIYEADLDQADLCNVYLQMQMKFADVSRYVGFGLFASDYVRRLRAHMPLQ